MMLLKTLLILSLTLALSSAYAEGMDAHSTEPHKVKTLETGTASLQKRLEMIDRAEKSIEVEFFIFDKSDAPRILVEALVRKKRESPHVRIRVLLDYFTFSKNLDPYYTTAMIKNGVEVKYYNPAFLLNFGAIVHRDHRKHIIVDGQEAIAGGRNMADEYFDMKEKHNYLDRDIWVSGPVVASVVKSFDDFWDSKKTKLPKAPKRPPATTSNGPRGTTVPNTLALRQFDAKVRRAAKFASVFDPNDEDDAVLLQMREDLKRIGGKLLEAEPVYVVNSIRYIADGPDWDHPNHSITGDRYYEVMGEAQKSLVIETPYFYLQKNENDFFKRLKTKGIDVDLLLNSKRSSNEFAINYISLLQGLKFSKFGFDLFLFDGTWMSREELIKPELAESSIWMQHSKTMLRDSNLTWIGSLNMDPRSVQRMNAESAFLVDDEQFNAALRAHVEKRLQASDAVVNGRLLKDNSNPANLGGGILGKLKLMKTWPFYLFENQI
jgi:cardiolipin synthase C